MFDLDTYYPETVGAIKLNPSGTQVAIALDKTGSSIPLHIVVLNVDNGSVHMYFKSTAHISLSSEISQNSMIFMDNRDLLITFTSNRLWSVLLMNIDTFTSIEFTYSKCTD
jgi:hypothetical protein